MRSGVGRLKRLTSALGATLFPDSPEEEEDTAGRGIRGGDRLGPGDRCLPPPAPPRTLHLAQLVLGRGRDDLLGRRAGRGIDLRAVHELPRRPAEADRGDVDLGPARGRPAATSVLAASAAAVSGIVVWIASAGHIRSPYLRAALAVATSPGAGLRPGEHRFRLLRLLVHAVRDVLAPAVAAAVRLGGRPRVRLHPPHRAQQRQRLVSDPTRIPAGDRDSRSPRRDDRRLLRRRFGDPGAGGAHPRGAAQFGASPFGHSLVFDATINADVPGAYVDLEASEIPQSLQLHELKVSLWGVPWDASHNAAARRLPERGRRRLRLREMHGGGADRPPSRAPSSPCRPCCGASLTFTLEAGSWQQAGAEDATATSGGPITGCEALNFDLESEGLLSVTKASSASGFVFRFYNEDEGLTNPRERTQALVKRLVVELPEGVTLNPSVGAGLGVCTPAQLAAETAFNPPGRGLPQRLEDRRLHRRPALFENRSRGSIYLAQPDDPATPTPGAENPFDSLLAVYLVAKSADRGMLFKLAGKLTPDPGDGTLTATFDDLPQLPYTHLEVNFRSGQRAPLVTPPACGPATTQIDLSPWSQGVADGRLDHRLADRSRDRQRALSRPARRRPSHPGRWPAGSTPTSAPTPPTTSTSRRQRHRPGDHLLLADPAEGDHRQTGRDPLLPGGGDRRGAANSGFAETAHPSCPAASQVGHTLTGYGVGAALTYAPGRIYLAGPYNGQPLSLVTINAATVGPFDLGTIVIRSAFDGQPAAPRSCRSTRAPRTRSPTSSTASRCTCATSASTWTAPSSPATRPAANPRSSISTLTGSGATFDNPADDSTATVSRALPAAQLPRPRLPAEARPAAARRHRAAAATRRCARRFAPARRRQHEADHGDDAAPGVPRPGTTSARSAPGPSSTPTTARPTRSTARPVAYTPLFDDPLRGNVYLRSSSHRLPDLVASLHSGAVRIVLEGRIGPDRKGGIRAFFNNLPDAPIEAFTMTAQRRQARACWSTPSDICATRRPRPSKRSARTIAARSSRRSCAASATKKKHRKAHHKHRRRHRR